MPSAVRLSCATPLSGNMYGFFFKTEKVNFVSSVFVKLPTFGIDFYLTQVVTRMGRWIDFKNDYKTLNPTFMESVWWVFKQLWDKDLVFRGFKVWHGVLSSRLANNCLPCGFCLHHPFFLKKTP